MTRRVAGEEDAVLGCVAERVRDPITLVANRLGSDVGGEADRRFSDVEPRVEGSDTDPRLRAAGKLQP